MAELMSVLFIARRGKFDKRAQMEFKLKQRHGGASSLSESNKCLEWTACQGLGGDGTQGIVRKHLSFAVWKEGINMDELRWAQAPILRCLLPAAAAAAPSWEQSDNGTWCPVPGWWHQQGPAMERTSLDSSSRSLLGSLWKSFSPWFWLFSGP